ncbi:Smr/MutS family protein [Solitalea koreensis]|uniref:Uncharacterized protein n=1 Tax=Solitalea koreensis TaxID=543615 RepID=A0A521DRU1_9SPHI|nr:Smr/MutS family protein [Solitalea koreensis]SMO74426.1 protein of unknown function [Solitalea koreensis]
MKFKLGDFVRFIDERLEGYVTKIIDSHTVGVTGDDDFEIPVLASKITLVQGEDADRREDSNLEGSSKIIEQAQTKGVFLAVVEDPKVKSVVHLHLVNDTDFQLLATLTTERQFKYKGEYAGIIAPKASVKLHSLSLSELDIWPKMTVRLLFHSSQNLKPLEPLVADFKFKAKDFASAKKQVAKLNQQGWVLQLDEPELAIDTEKLKESFYKPAVEKQNIEKPSKEVDLHIEKLRDDYQFISNGDILKIQMAHFRKTLDAAIVHKLQSIVFIHGVGNGTLRHEIHKTVSGHPQVQTYKDARKEKFGYGAAEVFLK